MSTYKPKEKILTEEQLKIWWDLTGDQLDKLRLTKGLPFVELAKGRRIYLEKSIAIWAGDNEVVRDEK